MHTRGTGWAYYSTSKVFLFPIIQSRLYHYNIKAEFIPFLPPTQKPKKKKKKRNGFFPPPPLKKSAHMWKQEGGIRKKKLLFFFWGWGWQSRKATDCAPVDFPGKKKKMSKSFIALVWGRGGEGGHRLGKEGERERVGKIWKGGKRKQENNNNPTTNGGRAKWKLSQNTYTLHAHFSMFGAHLSA